MTEDRIIPFTSFNFKIDITIGTDETLCNAAFSECDGLEMSMEVKTIKEGGNNSGPIHLIGPVSYGQLTLKRGMTDSFALWDWFEKVKRRDASGYYGTCNVIMLSSVQPSSQQANNPYKDKPAEQVNFFLECCLPVKLKAPSLNAKDGMIAIEEMTIAYQSLTIKRPENKG